MNPRVFAVMFIIIGTVLLVFGVNAWHSAASEVSKAVSGTPTYKAIVLVCAGVVSIVIGSALLNRSK